MFNLLLFTFRDGNEHGISLNILSPNNIIVKYADEHGNYILSDMPKYDKPGEYIIYFELSLDNNYKTSIVKNILKK